MAALSRKLARGRIRLRYFLREAWLPALVILYGAGLRLRVFFANQPFWGDEAAVALNLVERDYAGLLKPLDYDQGAPVGFLWLCKWAVNTFGASEYAMRLWPLLAGIATMVLFYLVARRCLGHIWAVIGLCYVAGFSPMIGYSALLKQYSSDTTVALVVLLVAVEYLVRPRSVPMAVLLAVTGGVAIWFSHPAIILLAGTGTSLFVSAWIKKNWADLKILPVIGAVWLTSFAANYFWVLRNLAKNDYLYTFWAEANGYLPWPPYPGSSLRWLYEITVELSIYLGPSFLPLLIVPLIVWGAVYLAKENGQLLGVLVTPVAYSFLAAMLHQYPLGQRLWIYILPAMFLLMVAGVKFIYEGRKGTTPVRQGVAIVCLVLLASSPVWGIYKWGLMDVPREDFRTGLRQVARQVRPNEVVYTYYAADLPYRYYVRDPELSKLRELPLLSGKKGTAELPSHIDAANQLRGVPPAWLIISKADQGEYNRLLAEMNRIGTYLRKVENQEARFFLYKFDEPAANDAVLP